MKDKEKPFVFNYLLYGSEMSYFSGKARAYLRWKGIDFEERNSDEKFYNQSRIRH